ncbi:MerR family transcriptional regulator [Clostridium sp. LIBA-8841]|uniref:MerR family transcriptional regulator n=1 Tax=Clostridium sp. LIBA-8841 TaxID=2987530 RepID=UPI002AC7ACB0|nr:MerR family transcriptional regulator [Clostridium sp. LIBA-8841]MDZ5254566.1 MerR family transcriptional regulator [Clostridium sp. LIBA-8841]
MYKVKEVSEITGVSIRMLHHYDKIGLLRPTAISNAGYRLYDDKDLELIQQILIYRELDFSLKEIKDILNNNNLDLRKLLKLQKQLIIDKRDKLNKIVDTIENTIKNMEGEIIMEKKGMFEGFDIEKHNKLYEDEVEKKYGESDAYNESKKKTSKYSKEDWNNIMEEIDGVYRELAELKDRDVSDEKVQELVHNWRMLITKNFYNCSIEIFSGLADMYIYDERFTKNIDKYGEGFANFLSEAMKYYCNRN